MSEDQDADANRMSAEAYERGEPSGWFEQLYAEAAQGRAIVPWDRGTPNPQLAEWAAGQDGTGHTAVVVGCGLGRDSEFIASLGYRTTGFDLSVTAIEGAKRRHPDTPVTYEVADLLDLPDRFIGAFDLVVESYTVQSVPDPPRSSTISAVPRMVAAGGTLVVIAAAGDEENPSGPPFPLTRREIDAFATNGLRVERVADLVDEGGTRRWRAQYVREG
ncbi:MAG: class I SAM-dependent methyltransferase [Jatrophihabitantaceae bacterium]